MPSGDLIPIDPTNACGFGFKIINNTIWGITFKSTGTSSSNVVAGPISVDTDYVLVAHYFTNKVNFYVDGAFKAQLINDLPDLDMGFYGFKVKTGDSDSKTLNINNYRVGVI